MNNLSGKWFTPLFYVSLVGLTFLITYGVARHDDIAALRRGDFYPKTRVSQIHSALSFEVADDQTNYTVTLKGVTLPTVRSHPELTMDQLAEHAVTAKNTLQIWIYKKPVRLTYGVTGNTVRAYAEIYGVDIGKKMLQGGMLITDKDSHERSSDYQTYQQEAEVEKDGIWRF